MAALKKIILPLASHPGTTLSEKLDEMGIDSVIVGKALYEGKISLREISGYCNGRCQGNR